ncbi:hypothetical protein F5ESL0245_00260 [Lactobacillus sp. ESL0245]|nr:hypothetical protein F5ESL0247_00260 [Lactobacillus sp. ESL0247]RMC29866.1 hypothetical protein F5ESL0246_00260 [Lactobacillus sp. ESL0246]RMC34523.1 hypothetical protein F5ESL0245_00260 [Lactobacillus sp. ESL0245]
MITLLLIFCLIGLFSKIGVGIFKILFFLLTCGIVFIFFVHFLIPFIIFGGIFLILFNLIYY